MDIKVASRRRSAVTLIGRGLSSNVRAVLIGASCAFGAVFFFGMGMRYHDVYSSKTKMLRAYFRNAYTRLEASRKARPEQITLDIKFKDFMKLSHKRADAMAHSVLVTGPDDFVPAKIRAGKTALSAKIRLKGDWVDHLRTEKWSFRIRLKEGGSLFGMREFSIQHPGTRNYIHEWIYHKMLERDDILAPRYDFIRVDINGEDSGIYAIEEHFDKILVESQRRREGPILKLNEDLMWRERKMFYPNFEPSPTGYRHGQDSPVQAFKMGRIQLDPISAAHYKIGASLLEGFRKGDLKPDAVFDVEKMAAYLAVNAVAGARHAALWHNIRFYYNPITSRLEPIGFDGLAGQGIVGLETPGEGLLGKLLEDRGFYRRYIGELERKSEQGYLESFLSGISGELREKMFVLHSEYPGYPLDTQIYFTNQRAIRNALNPIKSVHAFFEKADAQRVVLKIANLQTMPVDVYGLSVDEKPLFPAERRTTLDPVKSGDWINYEKVAFKLPSATKWDEAYRSKIRLGYRIMGTAGERSDMVFAWPYAQEEGLWKDLMRRAPNASSFPFVRVDKSAREIRILSGSWSVDKDLIFPAGYTVSAGPGTRLTLKNGASILSYSRLTFSGTEGAPILLTSSAELGGEGLVVMRAGGDSYFRYVKFEGLSNPKDGGWELTGAVTLYESPGNFENVEFTGARCEDSLNVVRTKFHISGSLFSRSKGDAFDADFSVGHISGSAFAQSGNDAIDVSGSKVVLKTIRIEGAGDKGISAGEISEIKADGVSIANAAVGAASKDVSILELKNADIRDSRIGLTAYNKKPEFGGGLLKSTGGKIRGADYDYISDERSVIEIDGTRVAAGPQNQQKILDAFK